jgi:hypothetical protein
MVGPRIGSAQTTDAAAKSVSATTPTSCSVRLIHRSIHRVHVYARLYNAGVHDARGRELYTQWHRTMQDRRPIVLHLGEAIKYNHEFYDTEFTERFKVVQNDCPDRATFIAALKDQKWVCP